MKSTAIILALIGCLWQVPVAYTTYVWCRAGHPNGYTYPTGNEPRQIDVSESTWRRRMASQRKDPSLWNDQSETKLAVAEFKAGTTRTELIREGFVSEDNPIRPLTSGEQVEMVTEFERWTYYNRGLEMNLLSMFVAVLIGFPWFLATFGCTVYWCIRRQVMSILISWTIPVLFLVITPRIIRAFF